MMRFSGCWPTLCSTSSWRTEALLERLFSRGLVPLSVATAAVIATAMALIFFYAPLDADQGFIQKIFYVHVPMAIVALVGFVVAGVLAAIHLRTRNEVWDHRSYVAIHISVIFGVGVL